MAAGGASEEKKSSFFDWKAALEETQEACELNAVNMTHPIDIPLPNLSEASTLSSSLEGKTIFGFRKKRVEQLSDEEKFNRMIGSAPGAHDWRKRAMNSSSEYSPLRKSRLTTSCHSTPTSPFTQGSTDLFVNKSKDKLTPPF
ncbi:MAG: hypothetical protein U1E78_04205 [Gammaproteobacteria bacterium]